MSRTTCTICGYSMTRIKSACPNCGEPLASQSTLSNPLSSIPQPIEENSVTITADTTSNLETYRQIEISGSSSVSSTLTVSSPPVAPPKSISISPPLLDGIIVDPPEIFDMPTLLDLDWSHIALLFLLPPLGLIVLHTFLTQQSQPERHRKGIRLRILQPSGITREARIEGDHIGTGISQGDTISLQGRNREGVLIVSHGYNHTAHGNIRIRHHNNYISLQIFVILLLITYFLIILVYLWSLLTTAIFP